MKKVFALLLTLSLVLSLAACGGDSGKADAPADSGSSAPADSGSSTPADSGSRFLQRDHCLLLRRCGLRLLQHHC